MQSWKVVDEGYLDYLRGKESRIPFSDYGQDGFKPFFGELFQIDDLVYVTQISHSQARHKILKNSLDFRKLLHPKDNSLMAVINLNYMFPIHNTLLEDLKFSDIRKYRNFVSLNEESKYIDLLKIELAEINQINLEKQALKLYNLRNDFPNDKISKRCLNFKELEIYALEYVTQLATND
jgi:protein AbiQ